MTATGPEIVNEVLLIAITVGISGLVVYWLFGRQWIARRQQAKVAEATRGRAFAVLARVESLAELIKRLDDRSSTSEVWSAILEEQAWLSDAVREVRLGATRPGFRSAAAELQAALSLVSFEVAKHRSLAVPNATRDKNVSRFAAARLRERSSELVRSARYMGIVAQVEGC